MIAAAIATPAMAREGLVAPRHFAASPDVDARSPGVLYIDGRGCNQAPRIGAFALKPWTNSKDIPCYPTLDYY